MTFGSIVEAFSLSHAQVLDGATSFLAALAAAVTADEDIYGVSEASLDPKTDEWDNEGDDVVESTWSWLNFADVSIKAGYLSFPLLGNLTSQTVQSSTAGGKAFFALDLWHEDSMNVPPKPMIIKMPSKDSDGNAADFVIGLYKVQFKPITFDGPKYKDGLKINYDGKALYSAKDETGTVFADGKKRIGRLLTISH